MARDKDNIPGFDDIVFESRNRDYGAYVLRKKYPRAILTGVLISLFVGSASVLLPFFIEPSDEFMVAGGGRYVTVEMEELSPPEDFIYVAPPPPPPPETNRSEEIAKYTVPVIVDTLLTAEPELATIAEALELPADDTDIEVYSNGIGDDLLIGDGSSEGEPAFFLVEVMPTFRGGGLDKFREWVNKRTNYPQAAVDAKIRGTVFLTFVVEKDGSVSNVTVLKGVHPLLDNEAVKAISESPRWNPGLQRGQPVRVRYQIPMSFVL
ncbi:MAG TPA: energy transducer TonB [Bacteroidales bacterium]|mgnify:FL=1|nr:energy transducer TonB [Bacteroidales bacterium]HPF03136.1 energy transducer TonB [Bacteroidales bacterium]HPJ58270.1 energy transducer TonB [Bacteroidales bacterium]HPR11601.1 energy transducer TonB [Bacteroidales bacterium]HRW85436.1 energy transducer TonB [Bacteroidales bacterium]